MLSILIPVFNFSVFEFINDLSQQCLKEKINYEILVWEDGSTMFLEENSRCSSINQVSYQQLSINIGRSNIRNALANSAQHQYLLFLDCDAQPRDSNFIKNYIDALKKESVIVGGRLYQSEQYSKEVALHWTFGNQRESFSHQFRKNTPYQSFMTNNFAIDKSTFLAIKLDESIKGYGHEDTLFGLQLRKLKVPIIHIDNPLYHIGLETNDIFIEKITESIRNLALLYKQKKIVDTVSLLDAALKIRKLKLSSIYLTGFSLFKRLLLTLIHKRNSLRALDFYKLGLLLHQLKKA